VKKDQVDRTCSTQEETRNAYKIFVGDHQAKRDPSVNRRVVIKYKGAELSTTP